MDRGRNNRQLADLISTNPPEAVLDEVKIILRLISFNFDTTPVTVAFAKAVDLYQGNYPGYQACTTYYHDLQHTLDTCLATARLIHGAVLHGQPLSERQIALGLIAALFHDGGYIQEETDTEGTGGKYTIIHVRRSMDFLSFIGPELGLSEAEILAGRAIILYTDLAVPIPKVIFPSPEAELLGQLLGVADIWAQISDQTYLEKLLFLYQEFKEGQVKGYKNELDLFQKTAGFYDVIAQRLGVTLESADRFLRAHFASRWNIQENLYNKAIENQKGYLKYILTLADFSPRNHLRRCEIVKKVRKIYENNQQNT